MPEPLLYLQALAVSASVSAAVVLAMVWAGRPSSRAILHAGGVLGVGSGQVLGCYVLAVLPAWPVNGLTRLLMIVLPVALAVELLAGLPRVSPWFAWCLRLGLAASIGRVLLHDSVYLTGSSGSWTSWQIAVVLAASAATLGALWALLDWLSERSSGTSIALALAISTQCAGICVMLAGYIQGGAAAIPLAAALAGTAIVASCLTVRLELRGAIGIGVVGLFGLLFIGRFFGELSTAAALTILLAPLLCWATEIPALRDRKPWIVGVVRLALVAVPLIVVLILAKRAFDREMGPLLGASAVRPESLARHSPRHP